jgi:hypothetical protein
LVLKILGANHTSLAAEQTTTLATHAMGITPKSCDGVSWVYLDQFFTIWLVGATVPMSDKKKKKPGKRAKKGAANTEDVVEDYAVSTLK